MQEFSPVFVLEKVEMFTCSGVSNFALKNNKLYSWGKNSNGYLVHKEDLIDKPKIIDFEFFGTITGIFTGFDHTIIITE